jgi:hypothetical protein
MPPIDFCNSRSSTCGQRARALDSSLGRWPRPPSGSDSETPSPCCYPRSGSERRAALSSSFDDPADGFLLLAQVCPPSIPSRLRHHRTPFGRRCSVTIDAHGSEDREKDASFPGHKWLFEVCPCARCVRLERSHAERTFPSSASSGHPLSPVLAPAREDPHANDVDRPRLMFHQSPAKGSGFPRTGMPSAVTLRPLSPGLLLTAVREIGLPPTLPNTFSPGWG